MLSAKSFVDTYIAEPYRNCVLENLKNNGQNEGNLLPYLLECVKTGWKVDPSGILLRKPEGADLLAEQGHTILDIIFLRPSDYHLHGDTNEVITCAGGRGELYMGDAQARFLLVKNKVKLIPKYKSHGFVPDGNVGFLKIALYTSPAILDMENHEHMESPWNVWPLDKFK